MENPRRRGKTPARRASVAGRASWPVLVAAFALTGCSLEVNFGPPPPGPGAAPCATCQAGSSAQKADDSAKPNGDQAGEKSKANGDQADEESGKEKEKPKQPKPRTLPQALCAYWRCLHTHGRTAEEEKDKGEDKDKGQDKDKDKGEKKEGNGQGAGAEGEKGEKNPPAAGEKEKPPEKQGSDNPQPGREGGQGQKGEKNPPAAGEKQKGPGKEGGTNQEAAGGKGEKGEKNPPATGDKEKEKENGEKKEEKDKDKEAEKEKEPEESWFSAHAQATMVTQKHNEFPSPYVGPLSLLPHEPMATSITGTIFLDMRLWECGGNSGDLVFNPEVAGGSGFSGTNGIAGFPNGEITRVGTVEPTPYFARLFLRQTWALGDEVEKVEDDANQIGGTRPVDRLTFIVGKLSAEDVVDDNRYSHDPRVQFLNWSIMYNSAWDYPANVRGYTYGLAVDYNRKDWAWRYGIFAEPEVANGAPLDPHFLKANGQVTEWQGRYTVNEHPGNLRLLAYLNHAHMGDYLEALEEMPVKPSVIDTRAYRFKYGCGMSWDQEISKDLGVFSRLGWSDGHTESWAFTPVDRTAVLGLALKGRCWCRPDDVVGLAGAINGLARDHRNYLAAGGLDFNIGDGRLRYAPEQILEFYYDYQVIKGIFVTFDFQEVNHPAYNADRGPVSVFTVRAHIEL